MDGGGGGIGATVAAQTAALNGGAIAGNIGPNFDPSAAIPTLDWAVTGPNAWRADFKPPVPAGAGGITMRMQWSMTIQTPDLIANTQQVDMMSCKVVSRIDYVRQ